MDLQGQVVDWDILQEEGGEVRNALIGWRVTETLPTRWSHEEEFNEDI